MAKVSFVAPGLAECLHIHVRAMLGRAGHEVVAPADADLVIANWFGGTLSAIDVRWWVGSDVLSLQRGKTEPQSTDERCNWASAHHLVHELALCGVAAREMPIVPNWEPEVLPRAERPVVLLYCPDGREDIYRWRDLLAVAERCPHLSFKVFRRSTPVPLPNVECVPGMIPHEAMRAEYQAARAVLRLMEHDGMSLSVLEALGFGRHAVWSYPYPACTQATTVDEAVVAIDRAVKADVNTAGVAAMETLRRAVHARLATYVEDAVGCK